MHNYNAFWSCLLGPHWWKWLGNKWTDIFRSGFVLLIRTTEGPQFLCLSWDCVHMVLGFYRREEKILFADGFPWSLTAVIAVGLVCGCHDWTLSYMSSSSQLSCPELLGPYEAFRSPSDPTETQGKVHLSTLASPGTPHLLTTLYHSSPGAGLSFLSPNPSHFDHALSWPCTLWATCSLAPLMVSLVHLPSLLALSSSLPLFIPLPSRLGSAWILPDASGCPLPYNYNKNLLLTHTHNESSCKTLQLVWFQSVSSWLWAASCHCYLLHPVPSVSSM